MTTSLFPADQPANEPTAPAAAPTPLRDAETARTQNLLQSLTEALGLDLIGRTVTQLDQDGLDPDDAIFTIQLDNGTRISLGTIATLMSRPKVQQILLVRLAANPTQMKAAEWADIVSTVIVGAATQIRTAESLAERATEWANRFLEQDQPTTDQETACLNRTPYQDPDGRKYLMLSALAKYVTRTTTEQITERKLAAALRDNGWEPRPLNYYPDGHDEAGNGKGRRSSVNYYRSPLEP
jgi:hypothetical protein